MGYSMNVKSQDLHFAPIALGGIRNLLDESWPRVQDMEKSKLVYGWTLGDETGQLEIMDQPISWTDNMLRDLMQLQLAGVRGMIEFHDDFGDFTNYTLTDRGLEERSGHVAYPEEPGHVWTSLDDLKEV
jgi:hypothetical protein